MDTDVLVEFQTEAGRRLVTQLVRDGFEVTTAFWVKTAEEDIWFLYIATPLVERSGLGQAYRLLHASLSRLQGIALSISDVKFVGAENPIARDVLSVISRNPGRLATRLSRKQLGSITIEGAYIYPQHIYDPQESRQLTIREDVLKEVVRLMNRGPGILPPSRVILRDGSSFNGVPFSIQTGTDQALLVQFIADGETAPRVVSADEITSIE